MKKQAQPPLSEAEFNQGLAASWQIGAGQLYLAGTDLPAVHALPDSWRELLASGETSHLKQHLPLIWQAVRRDLSVSLEPWLTAVNSVALFIPENGKPHLLYGLRPHGTPELWWGLPPQNPNALPESLQAYWPQLPADIQRWYGIHSSFQNRYGPFPFFENPDNWQWLSELVGEHPDSWAKVELNPEKVLILGTSRGFYFGLWMSDPDSEAANKSALGVLWDSEHDKVEFLDRPLFDLDEKHLAEIFEDLT